MAMYLKKIAVFTSMLQGCWCSDAFLRYIQQQVKDVSQRVSKKIISPFTYSFVTVYDANIEFNDKDPRISGNSDYLISSYDRNLVASAYYH